MEGLQNAYTSAMSHAQEATAKLSSFAASLDKTKPIDSSPSSSSGIGSTSAYSAGQSQALLVRPPSHSGYGMASINFKLPQFDGLSDFRLWRIRMRAILCLEGLISALDGEYPRETSAAEKENIERKAHSTIILSLSDNVLHKVADEETTIGLWNKLESLYMKKSAMTKFLLMSRMSMLKMQEGTPLQEHLDQFDKIVMDMKNADMKLDDEDEAIFLLRSLPDSYKDYADSTLYGSKSIAIDDIRAYLIFMEMSSELNANDSGKRTKNSILEGRTTYNNGSGRGKKGSRAESGWEKINVKCYHCHESGHFKRECPRLEDGGRDL